MDISVRLAAAACLVWALVAPLGPPAASSEFGMEDFRMTDSEYMASVAEGFALFEVLEPDELRFTFRLSPAAFSPPFNSSLPDPVALVPADPATGCSHLYNAPYLVRGSVLLVERGECSFVSKALQAQRAGAVALVVADSAAQNDDLFVAMVDDLTGRSVAIPAGFMLGIDGYKIRKTLEWLGRDSALIRIPVNITGYKIRQLKQPPWLVW